MSNRTLWLLFIAWLAGAICVACAVIQADRACALDVRLDCSTESTGTADIDSRYETFDIEGSERNYILSVFGDGTFDYRHQADDGKFDTRLQAEGTVETSEKIGLNLLSASDSASSTFAAAAGFEFAGRSIDIDSKSSNRNETLEYEVEAEGDGRYQSEAIAEERATVSDERMSDLLSNLHLELCPFDRQSSVLEAISTEQFEYRETGDGVFSHSFEIKLQPKN